MLNVTTVLTGIVDERATAHFNALYPAASPAGLELVRRAACVALEAIGTSDALYHNIEHTTHVTLVGLEILKARQEHLRDVPVRVWDGSVVKSVEKAIRDAGLGLNPQPDGSTIRIPIPDLNEERRNELVKVAGKYAEAARVSVRNVRRDAMDSIKKQEKVSEDEQKRQSDEVQKLTDDAIKRIDTMLSDKEADVMKV